MHGVLLQDIHTRATTTWRAVPGLLPLIVGYEQQENEA
jgi:hypothetical protein